MKKFCSSHHRFLVFFSHLYILTIFLPIFVSCRCPDYQKTALLNIFSNRSALPSWTDDGTSSSDCCQWEGITCDSLSSHVIGLDVSNRSIFSSLNSTALSSLHSLRFLNLSYNDFNASVIPSNLESLSSLTHLNLSHSHFIGQIPAAISRMTNLVVLDLSTSLVIHNLPYDVDVLFNASSYPNDYLKLEDLVLLQNLSRLTKLHLHGVDISSRVPQFLSNLTRLTSLDLNQCNLVGEIPAAIFTMPRLEILDMSRNLQLSGSFPNFPRENALRILKLSYTGFSGSLPNSFYNLSHLAQLSLGYCKFSGQIPPSLFKLPRLAVLTLRHNNFSGWIPPLDSLPSLKILRLNNNQLEGELHDLANASSTLEFMDLRNNKLQGEIPISFFGFRRLQRLRLSFNSFNGSVDFAMLPPNDGLWDLDLSHNNLVVNANYVDTSPFPRLQYLRLKSCNLKQFPHFLRTQLEMVHLELSDNEIAGEIPNWLWTTGNLDYLNLSGNSLTGLQPPYNLLSNSSVKVLDLHSNQLQGELPLPPSNIKLLDFSKNNFACTLSFEFGSKLAYARFFSISGNNISGQIPSSICNSSLTILDLSDNSLSGSIPNCFSNLTMLEVLSLKNNRFKGIIPNISSDQRCSLGALNLNGNQLEGKLPEALSKCRDLKVIDVGNNGLSGPFPSHLNILFNLRVLILRSNNFSGSLSKFCDASTPMLQIIDVASNSFSSTLPTDCFNGFKALMSGEGDEDSNDLQQQVIKYDAANSKYYHVQAVVRTKGLVLELVKITSIYKYLDLSNNKLEGEIPKEIGALKWLRVLNMSHNFFNGQIPTSIGNARQIESMDLSRNQLFGRIPLELNGLTFLEVLNLSYNQFMGSIPTGPQFLTFNNNSFIGNPELCGQPLSRKCDQNSSNSGVSEEQGVDSFESNPTNWLIISIQVGFTAGLGIVFGPLLLCRKWRMWYFKQVDMMLAYCKDGGIIISSSL